MKSLKYLAIIALTATTLSAQASPSKETTAATSYGQHLAFQKACKDVQGVSLAKVSKVDFVQKHVSEGGKKADFSNVVAEYEKATIKNLSQLDKYDLENICKGHTI